MFVFLCFAFWQEIATLREELTRLRRVSEDDRRRAGAAEMDREKASSAAREIRQSLERDLAAEKVGGGWEEGVGGGGGWNSKMPCALLAALGV